MKIGAGEGMKDEHVSRFYLILILTFLIILLVFANFIQADETRDIITIRIALFTGVAIFAIFTLFSFLGKWG